MAVDNPPPPPNKVDKPIADMREAFSHKGPQSPEERRAAKAFIEGKMEMIRRDPHMTAAQKASALATIKKRAASENAHHD